MTDQEIAFNIVRKDKCIDEPCSLCEEEMAGVVAALKACRTKTRTDVLVEVAELAKQKALTFPPWTEVPHALEELAVELEKLSKSVELKS